MGAHTWADEQDVGLVHLGGQREGGGVGDPQQELTGPDRLALGERPGDLDATAGSWSSSVVPELLPELGPPVVSDTRPLMGARTVSASTVRCAAATAARV
jgi:hypothetical protein